MATDFFKKVKRSIIRVYSEIEGNTLAWFREKTALFFTLIFPIVILIINGFVFGGVADIYYDVNYLNEDLDIDSVPFNGSVNLLDKIEGGFTLVNMNEVQFNTSEKTPSEWMIENEVRSLLIIPYNWSNMVAANITAFIQYYYDPTYTSSLTIYEVIDSVMNSYNAELTGIPQIITIEQTSTPGRESLSVIDFYIPGIIGITISTSGMIGLVNFIKTETTTGILYKKSSTPLKKWEWAAAKILYQIAIGLVIAVITVLTGMLVFGFKITMLHPLMLVLIILGTMTFAGIGLILTRIIKNPDAITAATMSFVFPQMFLCGAMFPLEIMPESMTIIAKFFPLYYMTDGMRNLMLPSTYHLVWTNMGILAAMAFVFFFVGVLIANWRKE